MRRLPPLNSLRAFEAAARHSSFAEAARELSVTATAVSHQIRTLEEFLGEPLFHRQPRPISLTPTGERIYPVLREGFDRFATTFEALRSDRETESVKVTTTPAFASRWLLPRLASLKAAVGRITLDVHASEQPVDLRSGNVDFAVRYTDTPPETLACHELFRDRYIPVCSPYRLPRHAANTTPGMPAMDSLIHFEWKRPGPRAPTWARWFEHARAHGIHTEAGTPQPELVFSEETHAIEAAIAGEGVALVSDALVARELESGLLVRAHELSLEGFGFYAVHLPTSPHVALIEAFVAWARESAAAETRPPR
ncbi:LysR substrate-binding domain-containing protein [Arhodomonas sp. AD133]|uniref:LysR substrate-binding domain-containing protein n=1 Tax=Arhodomonas sp. AD133 TaxID=3415009 RepID=UPI003EBCB735